MFRHRKKRDQDPFLPRVLDLKHPWIQTYADTCTLDDIYYCFRLLLGRNPSEQEWRAHSMLAGGRLKDVVSVYLGAPEFKRRQLGSFDSEGIELVDLSEFKMYIPTNDPQIGRHLYYYKTYQPPIANLLKNNLQDGDYFVDVGANIGYFSMLAASLVKEKGRVFSFEPFSLNVKLLHLNKQINRFDHVEIFPVAVGSGRALYLYDNSGTNGFISPLPNDFRSVMESTITYSMSLDELLNGIARLDYIKIDVEGAEYLVLDGARGLLRRHCPVIISEFTPAAIQNVSGVASADYLSALQISPDYEFFILDESGVIPCNKDVEKIINWLANKGSNLIDVLATPRPLK